MQIPPQVMAQVLRSGGPPSPAGAPPGGPPPGAAAPGAMPPGGAPPPGGPPPGGPPLGASAPPTTPGAPMDPSQAMALLAQLGITESAVPLVKQAIDTLMGGAPPAAG